ncbi:MAG: phosphate butyryltransferase [Firmicutes bacterium]|nr:phosphate butyryltransferase [Bacillota bacterium]
MVFKNFKELILSVQALKEKKRVAVVVAHDEHTLQAVCKASKDNIAEPILIGNKLKIKEALHNIKESIAE